MTIRQGVFGGRVYLYAVNDAPFAATARIHVEASASCRIEELTGSRKIEPLQPDSDSGLSWQVHLEPYDLVAVQLSDPGAQCSNPRTTWPETIKTALGTQILQLGARATALRVPVPMNVLANPGFESPAAGAGQIPDWAVSTREDVGIQLDNLQKHGGRQSARISSNGPVACLVSRPFAAPDTGRISMSVWLKVADVAKQPPLRLALEGKLRGRDYYRFAQVGLPPAPGQPSAPIQSAWGQYVFQVDDLPLEDLTSLRVRFDLMGPGEVWIDDVQIYSMAFSNPEMVELTKLFSLADVKLQSGQIGDCLHLLEGYWPRFLEENVPLPAGVPASETAASKPPPPAEEKPPERSGFLNRVKDLVPDSLRF